MAVFTVDVKTTPTRILVRNPDRKVYSVHNFSSVNVFIGYDNKVSTSGFHKGVKVAANGGGAEDEWHKGEVWAIASSNTEVTVVEVSEGE